jgi:site-specific recombinase XerD
VPLVSGSRRELAAEAGRRLESASAAAGARLSREREQRIRHAIWSDAGALKVDQVRNSFIKTTRQIGLTHATCPKSWRHTFATLLQEANVDPLVRQILMGHRPAGAGGPLGMTAVYTQTRPATIRRELERALRLWPRSLELCRERLQQGRQP